MGKEVSPAVVLGAQEMVFQAKEAGKINYAKKKDPDHAVLFSW